MELYTATLKGNDPLYPDYEAETFKKLKEKIADGFYKEERPAIVNLQAASKLDDRGRESPYHPYGLRTLEIEIEALIVSKYGHDISWSSLAHSATPITL